MLLHVAVVCIFILLIEYISLFSYSFDGHLFFWLLAALNKASMNVTVHICTVFLSKYLRVGIAGL